ncbi:MAG: nickel pincer cofactor biosynthesis protein LarC [Candidatus Sumerlaeaceae bacterium]
MTTAYFDCYNGISGDMTLGALVDLGLPIEELRRQLATLPVQGYTISAQRVSRCGIGATLVRVDLDGDTGADAAAHGQSHVHDHAHGPDHSHSHGHDHHHPHEHAHSHDHPHAHDEPGHSHGHAATGGHVHRGFTEIRTIIEGSGFSDAVKQRAIEAFHKIAVAEAAVHETTIEAVQFHEVGAVDAIVDIVGSMWGLEQLGVTRVLASPVAVGSGTIKAAHGVMPVPAPATARILAGVPIETGPIAAELATPTGAAILTTIAAGFGPMQHFTIERIGYGAGSRATAGHTNYLRVLLGQDARSGSVVDLPVNQEQLDLITTEIDDMPAEMFAQVMERLFEMGCLDVQLVPLHMKKNRPGTSLHVLVHPQQTPSAIELLLRETTTFGVKVIPCERYSLKRRMETVDTQYGPVRVKVGMWGEEVLKRTPEYEDCRRISIEKKVPLIEVYAAAAAASLKGIH